MIKDIEWLKGRLRGRKIFKPQNDREIGYNVAIDEFSEYVDQLVPKQELPVIPQFVADWIEEEKAKRITLTSAIYRGYNIGFPRKKYLGDNGDIFARAWLDGYTVEEEEQKYYIRDQHGVYLLAKNHREQGNVQTVAEIVEYYGVEEIELGYELTEEEIKGYDPRYMTFAKPIEELEE